jgi:hypothetical protein
MLVNAQFTEADQLRPVVLPTADEQLDAAYSDVKSVISIGRGIGYWGDMVVELRNGDKIEMRALPR